MSTPPFSLLLPVYRGDHAAYLKRAFESSVTEQTLVPDEVVIVRDGAVPEPLAAAISTIVDSSPVPVHLVELPQNRGLSRALTAGLERCSHEIVARIDADDESLPHRFENQLTALIDGSLDLVGGGMFEFASDSGAALGLRIPPHGAAIADYARFHDPFNHPTVVYRREAVRKAGGYREDTPLMEDYSLFARMIHSGARVDNLPEPVVRYRVDAGAYKRRGGWAQLRAELRLQRELRSIGFTTRRQALRNILVRGGYRLIPLGIRRAAYRRVFVRGQQ
ncbi:glycosyltransferase [Amnibacterium flavum]|uniref:Glycosyl transferase n=1 Tax=Amnibacterium flavum TaxID=2173173 RepID=A0A2V1HX54_9MICO|nr:glycosyltransferase [Amnibacterium flavum]PVZ95849.1 glycosyl transferase [Amnibacterium flavum]